MCLVAFGLHPDDATRLVLVGNRDEFHQRATAPLAWWPDQPILGGRDLQAGGTWFAIDRRGRFGALTNLRGAASPSQAPSRGQLIPAFLRSDESPPVFLRRLQSAAGQYAGFNLLLGDHSGTWIYSTGTPEQIQALDPGCHAVSNGLPGSVWPKTALAVRRLQEHLSRPARDSALARVLADRAPAPDDQLPQTGLSIELERRLSPAFIVQPDYGTRSTTVCVLHQRGGGWVEETSYSARGEVQQRVRQTLGAND
jgi:uncharacterized protein with NRDE domain